MLVLQAQLTSSTSSDKAQATSPPPTASNTKCLYGKRTGYYSTACEGNRFITNEEL